MSELDKLIDKRRSIRSYSDEIPNDELIGQLLNSVVKYPSPSNSRPVRIIRLRSAGTCEKIRTAMHEGYYNILETIEQKKIKQQVKNRVNYYYRYSEFMFNAPVLLAAGSVEHKAGFSGMLFDEGVTEYDNRGTTDIDISIGLALNFFMLKAVEYGLATCILSAPLTFIGDTGNIPGLQDIQVKCFLTLGYPAEVPSDVARHDISEFYREV